MYYSEDFRNCSSVEFFTLIINQGYSQDLQIAVLCRGMLIIIRNMIKAYFCLPPVCIDTRPACSPQSKFSFDDKLWHIVAYLHNCCFISKWPILRLVAFGEEKVCRLVQRIWITGETPNLLDLLDVEFAGLYYGSHRLSLLKEMSSGSLRVPNTPSVWR